MKPDRVSRDHDWRRDHPREDNLSYGLWQVIGESITQDTLPAVSVPEHIRMDIHTAVRIAQLTDWHAEVVSPMPPIMSMLVDSDPVVLEEHFGSDPYDRTVELLLRQQRAAQQQARMARQKEKLFRVRERRKANIQAAREDSHSINVLDVVLAMLTIGMVLMGALTYWGNTL